MYLPKSTSFVPTGMDLGVKLSSRQDTQSSTTKVIQLELPKPSSVEPISILQDNEIKCCFLYDVFELVRQVHIHPGQVANGSLKALLLKELEKSRE